MIPPLVRRILLGIAIAAGAAALVALGAAGFLMRTTTGAERVVAWVLGALPAGTVTVREVGGTLRSPLELRGVVYRTPTLSVSVERLTVHWRLAGLLRRDLEVRSLLADSVRVRRLGPPAPDTTRRAPVLPDLEPPVAIRVGELRVRDFVYVPAGDSGAFALDEVRFAGDFRGDLLRVTALSVRSALLDADLDGRIQPRREYPLDVNLRWTLRLSGQPEYRGRGRVNGPLDAPHVSMGLEAPFEANADARLAGLLWDPRASGTVTFSRLDPSVFVATAPRMRLEGRIALDGTIQRFDARGDVSMRSDSLGAADAGFALARRADSLLVERLNVLVPGRPERVSVRGRVTGLGSEPRAALVADWRNLVWPPAGDTLVRSESGTLHAAGTRARYVLRLDGTLATARQDLGRWRMDAAGDTAQLHVARLEGGLLGGTVYGGGTLSWKPRVAWQATLRGDSLDPAVMWPAWPGRLAIGVETEGAIRDTAPEFEARVTRLDGTLRRLPVGGSGSLVSAAGAWTVRDVALTWGDARLQAGGSAGERWDLDATIEAPDLGPVLEGASGAVRGTLRLTGPRDAPYLALTLHGDSLARPPFAAGALDVELGAGLREGDSLKLEVAARRATLAGRAIETLSLHGSGTTGDHALSADARSAVDTLHLAIRGALAGRRWTGSLGDLGLRTRERGAWQLDGPVGVVGSAEEVRVDSFHVRSGPASIRGAAHWSAGRALHAGLALDAVPLALLDPWIPAGATLEGTLGGTVDAHADRPEGPLDARAALTLSPSRIMYDITPLQRDTVQLGGSTLRFDSDARGARGSLDVRWERGDRLDLRFELPGFNALRPDTLNQPLTGQLTANATDLSVLGAYVPGLDRTHGNLTADLRIGGTLRRPDLDGEIRLSGGSAAIPELGVTLQEITLLTRCEPGHRITMEGSVRSGPGSVAITGEAELTRLDWPTVTLGLKGANFTVADTREADVRVSPDIHVRLEGSRVDVTGQLDVPFARLVTLDRLAQLPVPRSPDVVFTGEDADSVVRGPKVYSRVRVVISDDVEVRTPTLRGRPEGSILAIDEPGQATRATGELELKDGTYRVYGQDLTIERGKLFFGGGPISNPGLDLRASRTASDGTVAGFQIRGTAEAPIMTLFSTPSMSESDALSYIMFGKPMSETEGSGGAAGEAAGQLGVQGTDMLARGLAGKVGLQDASVESKEGSLEDASLFLGTYLSPKLYVSYGIGLFNSETTLRMRYKMSKHWSVKTESGATPSGMIQFTGER